MVSLILLPPLLPTVLSPILSPVLPSLLTPTTLPLSPQPSELRHNTQVLCLSKGKLLRQSLSAALAQNPGASIAMHPVDAPLHTLTLPPLPAHRRSAALRVKLEDLVLSDTDQLAMSVQTMAQHTFHVSTLPKALLAQVTQALESMGQGARAVVALTHYLPLNSAQTLGEWCLYRDALGAGALPAQHGMIDHEKNEQADDEQEDDEQEEDDQAGVEQESGSDAERDGFLTARSFSAESLALAAGKLLPFNLELSTSQHWTQWRWAALLFVLCASVYIFSTWWQWRSVLALQLQAQRTAQAAFEQALPNTPVVDMVAQLKAATAGGNALTEALDNIPAQWAQGAVTQMVWSNKRLSITVNASLLKLNPAQQTLTADNLAAKNIAVTWSKP